MRQIKKTNIIVCILILLITISFVSAEFWACFGYGEQRDYCNNYKASETCDSNNGCELCMSRYDETENCYVHGSWPKCNKVPKDCSIVGGNTTIDSSPPEFNLIYPIQNEIYTSRSILVEFSLNEKADVYYTDLDRNGGRYSRICNKCSAGDPAYSKSKSFKEGLNNLQFRAEDVIGNTLYENVSFFVDSRDPRITRTEPRRGFASGVFEVQFKEENPEILTLYYGNSINTKQLDIENDCYEEKGRYYCETDVDLSSYDGQEIEYWFELIDIAGNLDESKHYNLDVDTTFPVINNNPFYSNANWSKYVYFELDITEINFDEVVYTYIDNRGRLKERRICSRLKYGICEKKMSFKKGHHELSLIVRDEAGNSIAEPVILDINY